MIVKMYGTIGANSEIVLKEYCKKFRFHYQEVDENGARDALNKGRPVVARFYLDEYQWKAFSEFWNKKENKKKVMKANDLPSGYWFAWFRSIKVDGHAISLISHSKDGLRFLNSWGCKWGDGAFFKVKDAQVLGKMKFYDIYFYESDLTQDEKAAWKRFSQHPC